MRGGDTPFMSMGAGRAEVSLARGQPAQRLNGVARLNAEDAPRAGRDATGGAQRVSLAKMVRYDRTHLANSAKRSRYVFSASQWLKG